MEVVVLLLLYEKRRQFLEVFSFFLSEIEKYKHTHTHAGDPNPKAVKESEEIIRVCGLGMVKEREGAKRKKK